MINNLLKKFQAEREIIKSYSKNRKNTYNNDISSENYNLPSGKLCFESFVEIDAMSVVRVLLGCHVQLGRQL